MLYLAWRARRLIAQGFSTGDAFATLRAKYGPAANLPGRPDRVLAKLDDLIVRVQREGWRVPDGLIIPGTPQADAARREARRAAQEELLRRLVWLDAKLGSSDSELLTAALSDPKMRELAASVLPTTKRSRGRPRKMKTELEVGLAVLAVLREASRSDAIEDEIAQAVARRVISRQRVEARPQ